MGNTLIVYYSFEGNTEFAAKTLAEFIGADVQVLVPAKEPPHGALKFVWGGKSAVMNETPTLEPLKYDPVNYEKIIIAFPVWASSYPPAIGSFLKNYPFTGKKIYVVTCSAGPNTTKAVKKLMGKLEGNDIRGNMGLQDPLKDKEGSTRLIKTFADAFMMADIPLDED